MRPRLFNTPLLQAATLEVEDRQKLPLDVYQTAKLAFLFCLLWFTANWSVNASLDYTTVASATILSSTSGQYKSLLSSCVMKFHNGTGFFTLGIGTIFRVERLTVMKIVAVFTWCALPVLLRIHEPNRNYQFHWSSPCLPFGLRSFQGSNSIQRHRWNTVYNCLRTCLPTNPWGYPCAYLSSILCSLCNTAESAHKKRESY